MAKTVSVSIPIEEIQVKNNETLSNLVIKEIEKIEGGLTIIGQQIPVDDNITVDILCADNNGQIVVIKLSVAEEDNMLFEGLKTFHEINCVKKMLKFFNKNHKINDKELPRLILLSPSFSNNLTKIVKDMNSIKVNLYEWEYLKFGDKKSLRFKPVSLTKS
jgi:RecB family endonuclease NucS